MFARRICGRRNIVIACEIGDKKVIDPALVSGFDVDAYKKSLYDESLVVAKDGHELTWFTINPLTRRKRDYVSSFDKVRDIAYATIRCSLVGIKNYQIHRDDGTSIEIPLVMQEVHNIGECLTEETLDKLDFSENVLFGLSIMIREVSEANVPL